MKIGAGAGLIVCILLPIVLLLFGILDVSQTASGIVLLSGLWAVVYGLIFGGSGNRLYYVGSGIVIALISTFLYLPLQDVLGLVLLAVIVIVIASVMTGHKKPIVPTVRATS